MNGINLTPTEIVIEIVLLIMFPIILWGLYRFEQHRDKRHSQKQALK